MSGTPLGTTLGPPLPPDLEKSLKKTTFVDILVESILNTFFMFFECVFQVSISKAYGPHVLDFGLISASILIGFSLLFEDAGNLEK